MHSVLHGTRYRSLLIQFEWPAGHNIGSNKLPCVDACDHSTATMVTSRVVHNMGTRHIQGIGGWLDNPMAALPVSRISMLWVVPDAVLAEAA